MAEIEMSQIDLLQDLKTRVENLESSDEKEELKKFAKYIDIVFPVGVIVFVFPGIILDKRFWKRTYTYITDDQSIKVTTDSKAIEENPEYPKKGKLTLKNQLKLNNTTFNSSSTISVQDGAFVLDPSGTASYVGGKGQEPLSFYREESVAYGQITNVPDGYRVWAYKRIPFDE